MNNSRLVIHALSYIDITKCELMAMIYSGLHFLDVVGVAFAEISSTNEPGGRRQQNIPRKKERKENNQ